MIALVAILWAFVILRAPTVRQESWKRALWVAFAALAIALTAELAPVTRALDQTTGIADLATLVKHLAGIVACAAVLDWVIALKLLESPTRTPTTRHLAAGVAMVAMTVLFFLIPGRTESVDFAASEAGNGIATAYLLTFEAYLAVAMGIAAWMFFSEARRAPRGLLSLGVWTLAAGTGLGVVYAALRSSVLIVRLAGGQNPGGDSGSLAVTDAVQAAAILLILIGTFIPAIASGLLAVADYRALHRLRPLWWELTDAAPQIVLGTRASRVGDLRTVTNMRGRLLRRTVEIRDSALLLRGFVGDDDYTRARTNLAEQGLTGERLDAACEALWLRASLHAKKNRRKPDGPLRDPAPHASEDLAEEVRWLCRVADAYRSPAVRTTAAQLTLEPR